MTDKKITFSDAKEKTFPAVKIDKGIVTRYTQVEFDKFIELYECEAKGFGNTCAKLQLDVRLMWQFIRQNKYANATYKNTRANRTDKMIDDTIDIADNTLEPAQAKIQVQARQWLASKLDRKVYGDKLDVTNTNVNIKVYKPDFTDEETKNNNDNVTDVNDVKQ